jgi:hypothetical protein
LLSDDYLGWIVHDDFFVIQSEPSLFDFFEFFGIFNFLKLGEIFISKLLLNLSELLEQILGFLDSFSACLVISVGRHAHFFHFLLLRFDVAFKPVRVSCILIAWWSLLVEVPSDIDVFYT